MDFYSILSRIFDNKTPEVINNIIKIVNENAPGDSDDFKMENMVNLLSEIGGDVAGPKEQPPPSGNNAVVVRELLDEAAGGYYPLIEERVQLINDVLLGSENTSMSVTETLKRLIDMLPNADPSYLETKATELFGDETALEAFITNAVEKNDYPTFQNYLKNQEEKREKDKYVANFRVRDFLKIFPDPVGHFNDPERKHALAESTEKDEEDYALIFLCNHFNHLRTTDITKVFKITNRDLVKTSNRLIKLHRAFKVLRPLKPKGEMPNNIPLLQEIAFIKNEKTIVGLIKLREANYQTAKELGLLETCGCCFFEELIPEECYFCKKNCIFCKDCVKRGTETAIGQQKFDIDCFSDGCDAQFSLSTLQMVLDDVIFKGLFENKRAEEIKKANIEGLEYCPLGCNYAIIPNPTDKIFHCEVCQQDSCRECGHPAHTPKKCNEIEYDEDVKRRTYIENKMSESLMRKCQNCGKVYIKSSGCNKITCSCGNFMCYLCGAQIKDYSHFSQTACPLYTDDNKIHMENVIRGANQAKADLGVDKDPDILKFDPTKDLNLHF